MDVTLEFQDDNVRTMDEKGRKWTTRPSILVLLRNFADDFGREILGVDFHERRGTILEDDGRGKSYNIVQNRPNSSNIVQD